MHVHLERLSPTELVALHELIGREVLFFAQDITNLAVLGKDWQVNIYSKDVYCGDLKYFEVSGIGVNSERQPNYPPTPVSGFAFVPVPVNTVIRDVRIAYHLWEDEWTANNEPFMLRLEGGVIIDTDHGSIAALLDPYNFSYFYPFTELEPSHEALDKALNSWANRYELVSMSER